MSKTSAFRKYSIVAPLLFGWGLPACGDSLADVEGNPPELTGNVEAELVQLSPGTSRVEYRLTNLSERSLLVFERETPLSSSGDLFDVRFEGEAVDFIGSYATWAEPSAEDLVDLAPGAELSVTVDLVELYDMSRPGEYTVRARSLAGTTSLGTPSLDWDADLIPQASTNLVLDAGHVIPADGENGLTDKAFLGPSSGCTSTQTQAVFAAEIRANDFLGAIAAHEPSLLHFSTPGSRLLINNNFAPANFSEQVFIFDTYRGVREDLVNTFYICRAATHADCTTAGTVARTNKSSDVSRLCPLFFSRTLRSQAQTVIHEISHQNRSSPNGVGTDDLIGPSIHNAASYGQYAPRCFEGTCLPF